MRSTATDVPCEAELTVAQLRQGTVPACSPPGGSVRRLLITAALLSVCVPAPYAQQSPAAKATDLDAFMAQALLHRRTSLDARVERRLFRMVTLGADVERTLITFAPLDETFWTTGADASFDTRRDPSYPVDAILARATWNRLHPSGVSSFSAAIDRYQLDTRGYKRLFHQNVLALRAEYDTASAPLPPYEQWLLGGSSVRGTPAGEFVGDKRLILAAELRVPFSSPLSTGRTGFNLFMDAGATAPYGERLTDQHRYRGVGGGLWLTLPLVNLNLDVAHSLDGQGTRVHFGTGFSF